MITIKALKKKRQLRWKDDFLVAMLSHSTVLEWEKAVFFIVVIWGFLDSHAQRETHLWDSRATGIRSKHSDQGDCQESKT